MSASVPDWQNHSSLGASGKGAPPESRAGCIIGCWAQTYIGTELRALWWRRPGGGFMHERTHRGDVRRLAAHKATMQRSPASRPMDLWATGNAGSARNDRDHDSQCSTPVVTQAARKRDERTRATTPLALLRTPRNHEALNSSQPPPTSSPRPRSTSRWAYPPDPSTLASPEDNCALPHACWAAFW